MTAALGTLKEEQQSGRGSDLLTARGNRDAVTGALVTAAAVSRASAG
jgi:hypothetical protein